MIRRDQAANGTIAIAKGKSNVDPRSLRKMPTIGVLSANCQRGLHNTRCSTLTCSCTCHGAVVGQHRSSRTDGKGAA